MSINDNFPQSCGNSLLFSITADLCLPDICMYLNLTCCDWLTYIAITYFDCSTT